MEGGGILGKKKENSKQNVVRDPSLIRIALGAQVFEDADEEDEQNDDIELEKVHTVNTEEILNLDIDSHQDVHEEKKVSTLGLEIEHPDIPRKQTQAEIIPVFNQQQIPKVASTTPISIAVPTSHRRLSMTVSLEDSLGTPKSTMNQHSMRISQGFVTLNHNVSPPTRKQPPQSGSPSNFSPQFQSPSMKSPRHNTENDISSLKSSSNEVSSRPLFSPERALSLDGGRPSSFESKSLQDKRSFFSTDDTLDIKQQNDHLLHQTDRNMTRNVPILSGMISPRNHERANTARGSVLSPRSALSPRKLFVKKESRHVNINANDLLNFIDDSDNTSPAVTPSVTARISSPKTPLKSHTEMQHQQHFDSDSLSHSFGTNLSLSNTISPTTGRKKNRWQNSVSEGLTKLTSLRKNRRSSNEAFNNEIQE